MTDTQVVADSRARVSARAWRWAPWALLALVVAASVALPGAALLSEWESFTVYSTFGARDSALSLAVAPRANIGGQGYALLEASRSLLEATGMPVTLETIRIPSMICGAVALVFFFIVGRRWFGPWPALGATALLAVNPMFSQYQHELIVVMPSIMAFLILLERLQALDDHVERWRNWLTLGLAYALVLLLYGPGRVIATTLLVLWLVKAGVRVFRGVESPRPLGLLARTASAVAVAIVALVVVAPSNVRFLNPDLRILFPRNSENFLVSDSPFSPLTVVLTNARILAESLITGGGAYHANFIEGTMIQGRYALIPLVIVPIYLAGLVVSALRLRVERPIADSPYLAVLVLAALTSIPILTSSLVQVGDGQVFSGYVAEGDLAVSTLTDYRIAYFLVPAYLAVAVTLSLCARAGRTVLAAVVVGVILLSVLGAVGIVRSREDFQARMRAADASLSGPDSLDQWLAGYPLTDRASYMASHFQQHLQYRRWAELIGERLRSSDGEPGVIVVQTSLRCFSEAPLEPMSLSEINARNYVAVFLAAYLSGKVPGRNPAFVLVPETGSAAAALGEKTAVYSALLQRGAGGNPAAIDYVDYDPGGIRTMSLNGRAPGVIITTTPVERAWVTDSLTTQGTSFRLVDATDVCWGDG